ncbi:MAG: hypothetical protein ABI539_15710 [Acidobacteriota bacterium]
MPNVNVKLRARCLVNGQVREAGEIVDLEEMAADGNGVMKPFAESFGDRVKPAAPAADSKTKAEGE